MASLPSDPQQRQKLLLGLLLVLGLGYLSYTYLYTPRALENDALQARLETLEAQNGTARAITRGTGTTEVERQLVLYRDQLATVEGLIPLSEELPDLLDAISVEAQQTGVELSLIQPLSATEEAFYTRRTYELAVLGSYHDVGQFLTRVASLPRIVTPIDLNIAPQTDAAGAVPHRLEARFSIETYVLPLPGSAAPDDPDVE